MFPYYNLLKHSPISRLTSKLSSSHASPTQAPKRHHCHHSRHQWRRKRLDLRKQAILLLEIGYVERRVPGPRVCGSEDDGICAGTLVEELVMALYCCSGLGGGFEKGLRVFAQASHSVDSRVWPVSPNLMLLWIVVNYFVELWLSSIYNVY